MKSLTRIANSWLVIGILAVAAMAQSAVPPMLQDIQVYRKPEMPDLVNKTSSVAPVSGSYANSSIPALASVEIPGHSGILVQQMDGTNLVEIGSNIAFNPASNVKIATAYAVLKMFGPEYRFPTNVWTDGTLDAATGTLLGNVYISGRDPMFGYEHGVSVANELNRLGIRTIQGDLVVTSDFAMNYSDATSRTSKILFATLDGSTRSAAASRAWLNYLNNSGRLAQNSTVPSVTFTGASYVQSVPSTLRLLFTLESAPMREVLKATLSYSNNFLAERLGYMLGGPYGIARIVQQNTGVLPHEFSIQTASGLGINRVTPSAMMKLLRVFRDDLARYRMTFADVMPVAGVDVGTLEERFDNAFSKGSVVGKTGTLGNTDGGVSTLAGEINTRNGRLLFVIFNQRGRVARFKSFQNFYVSTIQSHFGGAVPFEYTHVDMEHRLAKSRVLYPALQTAVND